MEINKYIGPISSVFYNLFLEKIDRPLTLRYFPDELVLLLLSEAFHTIPLIIFLHIRWLLFKTIYQIVVHCSTLSRKFFYLPFLFLGAAQK